MTDPKPTTVEVVVDEATQDKFMDYVRTQVRKADPVKTVTIRREDAQRLFDLATDSPLVCSGSFETDDVVVLRRLATLIGVDPAKATPDEFVRDFPHQYRRLTVRQDRGVVFEWIDEAGVVRADFEPGYRSRRRPETDAEWSTRVAEETGDTACKAGLFARPCGRPEDNPIHIRSEGAAA